MCHKKEISATYTNFHQPTNFPVSAVSAPGVASFKVYHFDLLHMCELFISWYRVLV